MTWTWSRSCCCSPASIRPSLMMSGCLPSTMPNSWTTPSEWYNGLLKKWASYNLFIIILVQKSQLITWTYNVHVHVQTEQWLVLYCLYCINNNGILVQLLFSIRVRIYNLLERTLTETPELPHFLSEYYSNNSIQCTCTCSCCLLILRVFSLFLLQ